MYEYKAVALSNYDGDTVRMDVDLGWGIWVRDVSMRLNRINTPELRDGDPGLLAKMFLEGLLPAGTEVVIRTIKDKEDKYGRMLVEIYHASDVLRLRNINDLMVSSGFAKYWDGKGARPV